MHSATEDSGTVRAQVSDDVRAGTNLRLMSPETALTSSLHVLSTPSPPHSNWLRQPSPLLVDTNPQAATSLSNQNLDAGDPEGALSWVLPRDRRVVTHHQVYLLRLCWTNSRSTRVQPVSNDLGILLPEFLRQRPRDLFIPFRRHSAPSR